MNPPYVPNGKRFSPKERLSGGGFMPPYGLPTQSVPGVVSGGQGSAVGLDPAIGAPPIDIDGAKVYTIERTEYSFFTVIRGVVGAADLLVLPQPDAKRVFLQIINLDPANLLTINFGTMAVYGVGGNGAGAPVPPNYGSYTWDKRVPQDDIHLIGSAANVPFCLIYSNRADF